MTKPHGDDGLDAVAGPPITIRHAADRSCYELYVGDQLASVAEYHLAGGVADFVHTHTVPAFGGRGLAGILVDAALTDAHERAWRIRPSCWYVRQYVDSHADEHPEWVDDGSTT